MDQFGCLGFLSKIPIAPLFDQSRALAAGTGFYPRDVIAAAANGHMFFSQTGIKITTPTVSAKRTTGQVFTAGTVNTLTPNAVDWDNNQFWDSVTHPTRLTCKSSGLYLVAWHVEYEAKSTVPFTVIYLLVNGVEVTHKVQVGGAGAGLDNTDAMLWYFEEGDYCEMQSYYSPTSRNTYLRRFQLVGITPEAVF